MKHLNLHLHLQLHLLLRLHLHLHQVRVLGPEGWALLHAAPIVREDASMHGCRTEFTRGGVNRCALT